MSDFSTGHDAGIDADSKGYAIFLLQWTKCLWQTNVSKREEALKKYVFVLVGALTALSLAACAPSASQMKKVLEDNPEILFSVIEKHPNEFLQTVNKAASQARAAEEQRMAEEETKKRDEEFKAPKQPALPENRAYAGEKTAPVTIVEYSDFQCPYCRRGHATMEQLLKEYPGKVRVLFKNLPIERIHPHALIASKYYEAIALQDPVKAIQFQKMVFDNQDDFSQNGEKYLKEAAKKVGANVAKLSKDISSDEVKKRLDEDRAEAEKFEFSGTPGYLINGVSLRGAYPVEEFKQIIDKHLGVKK